ncbi:insulin gene enhancer protein ISL-2-like [Sceloporus undulatus]|uniref:insulin gene enhancer protein ISL-2-like n=1 Tax=Sceloporus undulatus TaxID=8520 RepID=UPI001C4C2C56|nr:insulin gene enhancer protein ISL-2-like [Sceloporus undulatus]
MGFFGGAFMPISLLWRHRERKKPPCAGGVSLCVGCGSEILDQYILRVSPDLEWHAACLKCHDCSQFLDETCTCFVRDGKTYCKRDYLRLFGVKCGSCSGPFGSSDLVMRARERVFHLECFRCSLCATQLLPGDEFALREAKLLCSHHHRRTGILAGGQGAKGSAPGSPPENQNGALRGTVNGRGLLALKAKGCVHTAEITRFNCLLTPMQWELGILVAPEKAEMSHKSTEAVKGVSNRIIPAVRLGAPLLDLRDY